MMPTVIPPRADAAASSSRGSRRGTIAWRVASTIELAAELTMLSAYSHHTVSSCVQARRASRAVEPNVTVAAMSATLRRSNASASMPP